MTEKINPEQVKAEVNRFWNAFASKDTNGLADFYSADSSVFGSAATRAEPGRLAAARRQREYFNRNTTLKVQLGPIEVVTLGDKAAVASYTFQFHASKVAGAFGQAVEEDIVHGRGSHVFAFDADGRLRIVHEHLSTVDKNGKS